MLKELKYMNRKSMLKIRYKTFLRVALIITLIIVLGGCGVINKNAGDKSESKKDNATVLGDLAYDEESAWGYRIYIEEDNRYVPFLVLTANYNGNCLLLREYLLAELSAYNQPGEYGSYYKDSTVDKLLNEDYYPKIMESTRQLIVKSEIEITSKNAIYTGKKETETIERYVFLLSATELNCSLSHTFAKEGKPLDFFKKNKNKIAMNEDLEPDTWMLRTPELGENNITAGIAGNGSIGTGGINTIAGISECGVRPAFCIEADTPIIQSEGIVEGETVFCIK